MKVTNVLMLILVLLLVSFIQPAHVSAQPYTSAKYVKTAVDTFTVPGLPGVERKGQITNESDSVYLNVYFSNDTGAKLTTSYIRVPPHKSAYFNENTVKIFRSASKDSVYSQIIMGNTTIGQLQNDKENFVVPANMITDNIQEAELTGLKFPITSETNYDLNNEKHFIERRYLSSDLTYKRL